MARIRTVDPIQQVRDHAQRVAGVRSVRDVDRAQRETARFLAQANAPLVVIVDALPDIESAYYGNIVVVNGGTGIADAAYMALRTSADVLAWVQIDNLTPFGRTFADQDDGNSGATNTTTTPNTSIRTTFVLPAGTWDVTGRGTIVVRHSAAVNNQMIVRMIVGAATGNDMPGQQPTADTRTTIPVGVKATGAPSGNLSVGIDFRLTTAASGTMTAGSYEYSIIATRTA